MAFEELFHARTGNKHKQVKAVTKPCLPFLFAGNAPPHSSARSCKLEINSSEISTIFLLLVFPFCPVLLAKGIRAWLQTSNLKKAWGHYFCNSWLNKELACSLQSPLITYSPGNPVTTWKREFLLLHAVLVMFKKWHTGSPYRHKVLKNSVLKWKKKRCFLSKEDKVLYILHWFSPSEKLLHCAFLGTFIQNNNPRWLLMKTTSKKLQHCGRYREQGRCQTQSSPCQHPFGFW